MYTRRSRPGKELYYSSTTPHIPFVHIATKIIKMPNQGSVVPKKEFYEKNVADVSKQISDRFALFTEH